ncbi:hypothetical protein RQP46_002676 [Phenoliferia psychrophenolica]
MLLLWCFAALVPNAVLVVLALPATTQRVFGPELARNNVTAPAPGTSTARSGGERVGSHLLETTGTWDEDDEGVGHFSEWSRNAKVAFLEALKDNRANDWVLVMGNEGGGARRFLVGAAMEWTQLIASSPYQISIQWHQLWHGAIICPTWPLTPSVHLVDHNVPRTMWGNITILGILDHHEDRHLAANASPRVVAQSASCSSLVTEAILDSVELDPVRSHLSVLDPTMHGPIPEELIELLLRTIALDSAALKTSNSFPVDYLSAQRLLDRSSWRGRHLHEVIKTLKKDMKAAKNALHDMTLRDLLRRDWKGDVVPTKSPKYPTLSLGLASMPVSLNGQILRLPEQTAPEWFAVERAWTAESGTDVSVVLTGYRDPESQRKVHEIALVVAHGWGKRLHEHAADRLFEALRRGIMDAPELDVLEAWERPDGKELLPRRAVWRHFSENAGRKTIRPIVERVAREWEG